MFGGEWKILLLLDFVIYSILSGKMLNIQLVIEILQQMFTGFYQISLAIMNDLEERDERKFAA